MPTTRSSGGVKISYKRVPQLSFADSTAYLIRSGFDIPEIRLSLARLCSSPDPHVKFDLASRATGNVFLDNLGTYICQVINAGLLPLPVHVDWAGDEAVQHALFWWVYEWRKEEKATRVKAGKVKGLSKAKEHGVEEPETITKLAKELGIPEVALRLRLCGVASEGQPGFQELAQRLEKVELQERSIMEEQARLQHRVTNVENEQELTKKEVTAMQNAFKEVQETAKEQSSTTSILIHAMSREQAAQALASRNMNSSLRVFLRIYPGASADSNGTLLRLNLTDIAGEQYTRVELGKGFSHVFDGKVLADSDADDVAATFVKQFFDSLPHTVTINLFLGMSGSGKTTLFNRVIARVGASTDRISLEEWGIDGSVRALACTREVIVAKTLANSNSSRSACCGVFRGVEGRKLVLLDLPGDESSETRAGFISTAAKNSSKISTSDTIAMILLELRPMLAELFPPRLQPFVRGGKHVHPPTQKMVKMVNDMLRGYLGDLGVLVEMNLVVCGNLKPESIKWWKVMNEKEVETLKATPPQAPPPPQTMVSDSRTQTTPPTAHPTKITPPVALRNSVSTNTDPPRTYAEAATNTIRTPPMPTCKGKGQSAGECDTTLDYPFLNRPNSSTIKASSNLASVSKTGEAFVVAAPPISKKQAVPHPAAKAGKQSRPAKTPSQNTPPSDNSSAKAIAIHEVPMADII
ncbi:hypothetical protein EV426DRAFT_706450 [Tirmania nivea]|nr:hypothetical protein EV426DRAFT_706450 [Tirmania nivea]